MPRPRPETDAVAAAIRTVMKDQALSGAELAARVAQVRGEALPYDAGVWISKRLTGKVALVKPVKVEITYGPTSDLVEIAGALGVPTEDLVRIANDLGVTPTADTVQEGQDQ